MPPVRIALLRIALSTVFVATAIGCAEERHAAPTAPSVVIVTLDTTRVDHLSAYGYARETTPQLDAFAERAIRYRRAWSTSSWTLPAHASLFTALHPSRHGAHYSEQGNVDLGEVLSIPLAKYVRAGRLPDERTTLAEIMAASGRRTGAFVAGPWLNRSFGLMQGFEEMDDDVDQFGGRPADLVTDRALAWLDGLPGDASYFLFVNYFDPHAPYTPKQSHADLPHARQAFEPDYDAIMRGERPLSDQERQVLIDRYDAEIREMDAQLGRLLDAVLSREGGERTWVIVTADHGEALGEGGRFGHGFWLSEELIRVPMIVRHPGDLHGGSWSDEPIQLVDVLPLLADELGLPLPDGLDGVLPGTRDVAIAEIYREPTTVVRYGGRYDRDLRVAIAWPHKLERPSEGDETVKRLSDLDLEEQPHELTADAARRIAEALDAHVARAPANELVMPEVSDDTVEALRRLGYVD